MRLGHPVFSKQNVYKTKNLLNLFMVHQSVSIHGQKVQKLLKKHDVAVLSSCDHCVPQCTIFLKLSSSTEVFSGNRFRICITSVALTSK